MRGKSVTIRQPSHDTHTSMTSPEEGGFAVKVKSLKLTEKQFMQQVILLAHHCGWRVYHTHNSKRSVAGFPDLVLLHTKRQRVLYAELKVGKNLTTPDQAAWLDDLHAAGEYAKVWRPEDWSEIERVLAGTNPPKRAKEEMR